MYVLYKNNNTILSMIITISKIIIIKYSQYFYLFFFFTVTDIVLWSGGKEENENISGSTLLQISLISLCIFAYTSFSGCFQSFSLSDFLLLFVFLVFNGITSNTAVLCCIAQFPVLLSKIPGESHANYQRFPNCTQHVFVNIQDGRLLKMVDF